MALPSSPTRTNCDNGADDPKQALLADLFNVIGTVQDLITHLNLSVITSTPTTIGDGLENSSGALRAKVREATLQNQSYVYNAATGTNALTVTLSPAPSAYTTGMKLTVKAAATNTGGMTINVNSLGSKTITDQSGAALGAGDVQSGGVYDLAYDGTNFQLLGGGGGGGSFASGTSMLFRQTSAPSGWTKQTAAGFSDAAFRCVTGTVTTGGADAFSTHFGTGKATASHTLTEAQIPSHTHSLTFPTSTYFGFNNTSETPGPNGAAENYIDGTFPSATGSAGSGSGHTHDLNNFNIKYVDIIVADKD
jgi:hypothetical protein